MTPRTRLLELTRGERLARARKVADLSQTTIAAMLGVDRRTVTRWEADTVEIGPSAIRGRHVMDTGSEQARQVRGGVVGER